MTAKKRIPLEFLTGVICNHCGSPLCAYCGFCSSVHNKNGIGKSEVTGGVFCEGYLPAESLPAQPAPKVVYDAWGKAGRLQPLWVEAKEKELCINCGLGIEKRQRGTGIEWIHVHNNRMWCMEGGKAEPKPTPSTPTVEKRTASVAAYIGITEDQIRRFVGAMNMVGLEIAETSQLPQPDSSSITEQTFEEVWKEEKSKSWVYGHLIETYPNAFRYVAETFWAAAKGLK